jgi:hypothetical protein
VTKTTSRDVKIAGRPFRITRGQVERAMRGVLPDPVQSHYVAVGNRRYPPKQVIERVTGLDRADFTTHHARRVLTGLGFAAGRRTPPSDAPAQRGGPNSSPDSLLETLHSLTGQWVAVADEEVLVVADTPYEIVAWLSRHKRRADSVFRVPEDEVAASGIAPL